MSLSRRELADRFGVSPYTIQKYTYLGIIPRPVPPRGRYAAYDNRHVAAMEEIWGWNGLKDSNVTLAEFAERKQIEAESRG